MNLFSIVSCSFYQTRIAINVNLKEKYISKNFEYDSCIIEIDNELTEVNRYYYDTSDKEFKTFAITSNDICIFYIDNNSYPKKIVAQYLNDEVIYKKIPFELETNYIINDVKNVSIDGNDIYLSINYIGYVDSTYLGFLKVNSFEGVDYYYNEEKKVNYLTTNLCGKSIFNWYYTNKSNNEISLKSYNILSYKTKKLETYHKNTTYKDVYFNFKKLSKNETEDTEQFKIFGNYESIDVFKLDNVSLFFKRKDEVRLQVNVLENDIYEPGYKVEFNGTGFLNGEEINTGFIVNDIGKYLLAIYGINNEKEVINFEIDDLTINPISNNYNFKIKDIEIIKTVKVNDLVKTMNINIENQSNASALPVFLSILILGVLSLFFMRKKI